jgi:hypothetical protein
VSPVGLVPKGDNSGYRLIHDCSLSVNDCTVHFDKQSYESIDSAVALLRPGYYMAKVDIRSAYRAVALHESSYQATGLSWPINGKLTYLIDTRLPFGARPSPTIFHRLSQSVKRMLARKGITKVVAYQDDFLVIGETYEECICGWISLIQLLMDLGFGISYNKLEAPAQVITFLGIRIDSKCMQLSLPSNKMLDIKQCIGNIMGKSRANKRQLQSLAGKLNYASRVVRGGRTFLRRLLNAINTLRQPHHKARIQGALLQDILWWKRCMFMFNGTAAVPVAKNACTVLTDACQRSGGAFCSGDFIYTQWKYDCPDVEKASINYKEAFMAAISILHWSKWFRDRTVYIYTDNKCTMSIINKCTSRNRLVMDRLRDMFWASVANNFIVKAIYMPGVKHVLADTISRMHEPRMLNKLQKLLHEWFICHTGVHIDLSDLSLSNHMTWHTLCSILPQVVRWRRQNSNSMTWWGNTNVQHLQSLPNPPIGHS